jgi:hypothetical protein
MTVSQAAEALDMSPQGVRDALKAGRLRKVGERERGNRKEALIDPQSVATMKAKRTGDALA